MNDFNEDKFPGLRKHRNMYYLHATACVGKHKLCTLSLFASVERLYSFATILDLPQYGSICLSVSQSKHSILHGERVYRKLKIP